MIAFHGYMVLAIISNRLDSKHHTKLICFWLNTMYECTIFWQNVANFKSRYPQSNLECVSKFFLLNILKDMRMLMGQTASSSGVIHLNIYLIDIFVISSSLIPEQNKKRNEYNLKDVFFLKNIQLYTDLF